MQCQTTIFSLMSDVISDLKDKILKFETDVTDCLKSRLQDIDQGLDYSILDGLLFLSRIHHHGTQPASNIVEFLSSRLDCIDQDNADDADMKAERQENSDLCVILLLGVPGKILDEWCGQDGLLKRIVDGLLSRTQERLSTGKHMGLQEIQQLKTTIEKCRNFDRLLSQFKLYNPLFSQFECIDSRIVELEVFIAKREQVRVDRLARSRFGVTVVQGKAQAVWRIGYH